MFLSEFTGILIFLVTVFFGPALILAGFQKMSGQKVRIPPILKPLAKTFIGFVEILSEVAELVASVVAEKLPGRHAHLQPVVRLAVRGAIIGAAAWFFLNFLRSLGGK